MKKLLSLVFCCALSSQAAVYYVTVAGLGGEPDYETRFSTLAKDLDKLLKGSTGEVQSHVFSGADATREKISAVVASIAAAAKPDDSFVLMLIGHGTFDGSEYKINLPGRDLSAVELAQLCDKIPTKRQLVVNMTSASGASIDSLQKVGRAVITATKSGTEKNATVFARYWVEAFRDPAADADKNEIVSALEAFQYADSKTVGFYETQKRLSTEHAVIEDTGKGEPARTATMENGQGRLAGSFSLLRFGKAQQTASDPAKRALLAKKEEIEQTLDKLRYEKAAMPAAEYTAAFLKASRELARVNEELEK